MFRNIVCPPCVARMTKSVPPEAKTSQHNTKRRVETLAKTQDKNIRQFSLLFNDPFGNGPEGEEEKEEKSTEETC